MPTKKTILLVDDHPFIREGLKAIISNNSKESDTHRYEIVGEAGNGSEAIDKVQRLKPDLCLMDISLPDQSGIELTGEIKRCFPMTKVLILSMHSKIEYIAEAMQAGAAGYLVKDSASEKLMDALDWVSKGEYYLDNTVSTQVVRHLKELPTREKRIADPEYKTLTSREQEVLRMLAEGVRIEKIGEKMFISPKTVKNHRASIMRKLNIHNSHELVRYAAKVGLIDVDLWKV
jgi:DNA-binding NarL/FixJ family response regulator